MARSTIYDENPDRVASRDDACVEQQLRNTSISNTTTSCEPSGQSPAPSRSCYSDQTANLDPEALLRSFLLSLDAKEIAGPRDCRTFVLQPGVYTKTLESLQESDPEVWAYVFDELKHDLIDDKYLVVKMPGIIHEFIARKVNHSIETQLITIGETSNEPTKRLIQDIEQLASRRIQLYHTNNHREPNGQFLVKGSYFPGVVLEMAYSEDFKSLRTKAQDLIVRSAGNTQLVIGLETGNKKSYKISAWRPDFIRSGNEDAVKMEAIIEQDEIQNSGGKLKHGSLIFQLQVFGSNLATTYPNADLTKVITLHYHDLADYLTRAQEFDVQRPPLLALRPLKEPPQPTEEITPEDGKKFCQLENKSSARSEASDPDY